MKAGYLIATAAALVLNGCALTHYASRDEKPDDAVVVTSNVAASLWEDGQQIAPAKKEHVLKNTGMRRLTLKSNGYGDLDVLVWQNPPEKKSVSSQQSSLIWTTKRLGDVSSDLSDTGADAATTSPTSTVMLPVNLVKTALGIVWLPFDFSTQFNPSGYYYAYGKNQFRATLRRENAPYSPQKEYEEQVEKFTLVNYPLLARRDAGALSALAKFSGITTADIEKLLKANASPESMAEAVVEKMTVVRGE